jgi:hypothetical protein
VDQPPDDELPDDWEAFFAPREGPEWVELTPERVAIINLQDCAEQLERSAAEPIRLAMAAKAAHLAMQAALTAALAGSANIGAHPQKLKEKWLSHLEDRGSGAVERPASDRVMAFSDLLKEALASPLPWSGQPLVVTDEQHQLLERLSQVRHGFEHPKQATWSIEPAWIAETIPVAARLAVELLEVVFHHLEPGEAEQLQRTAERIAALCES